MAQKKEILVLGGGICGLTLLWYLRRYLPNASIRLLEKSSRVGGVIDQVIVEDMIIDLGPKTLRMANGAPILDLIDEVNLTDQLIFSSEQASRRYLYVNKTLQTMPHDLFSFLSSPITRKIIPALIKELCIKKGSMQDETIGAFIRRRFGNYIADVFVQPFVMGICGGDMHKLSISSYFPLLKKWEAQYGSVVKAVCCTKKGKKKKSALFNLQGGLATLTNTLGELLHEAIHFNQEVHEVVQVEDRIKVHTSQGVFLADHLFTALPLPALKKIKLPFDKVPGFFHDVTSTSLVSVSIAYKDDVLLKKGFGYLVPSKEGEQILGVLFDKATFPHLDRCLYQTKLTVMMGGMLHPEMIHKSNAVLIQIALDALYSHLGIAQIPDVNIVTRYPEAIPQYPLYHGTRLEQLQKCIRKECPSMTLAGSYLTQASISACISQSKMLAQEYARC